MGRPRTLAALALAVLISSLVGPSAGAASATTESTIVDGITYTADNSDVDAGASVTHYDGVTQGLNMILPSGVNISGTDYAVTRIGDSAFAVGNLKSITIPESVTTIGDSAFAYTLLTTLTIPDSVVTIGDSAFAHSQLASVTLGTSLTTIGDEAFGANQLTSVVIGDSVTSIGEYAFASNHLVSVTLGSSLTTMAPGTFFRNELTSVTLPSSITTIDESAFGHNELTAIFLGNSVTTIGDSAFSENSLQSIVLPNSVTTIGNSAFSRNKLQSVTIPGAVTTIGDSAFAENRLESVVIGASVDSIGNHAFSTYGTLDNISFSGPAPKTLGEAPFGNWASPIGPVISYEPAYAGSGFTSPTWTAGGTEYRSQEVGAATVTPTSTDNGINPAILLGIASLIALAGAAGLVQFRRHATTSKHET